jgi:hypothetical protein
MSGAQHGFTAYRVSTTLFDVANDLRIEPRLMAESSVRLIFYLVTV